MSPFRDKQSYSDPLDFRASKQNYGRVAAAAKFRGNAKNLQVCRE
jgi:hypothetical protein